MSNDRHCPAADLGVVERLDEKIRQLITLVEKSRAEATKLRADNDRLGKDVDALQAQLTDAAGVVGRTAGHARGTRPGAHARRRHARPARRPPDVM